MSKTSGSNMVSQRLNFEGQEEEDNTLSAYSTKSSSKNNSSTTRVVKSSSRAVETGITGIRQTGNTRDRVLSAEKTVSQNNNKKVPISSGDTTLKSAKTGSRVSSNRSGTATTKSKEPKVLRNRKISLSDSSSESDGASRKVKYRQFWQGRNKIPVSAKILLKISQKSAEIWLKQARFIFWKHAHFSTH